MISPIKRSIVRPIVRPITGGGSVNLTPTISITPSTFIQNNAGVVVGALAASYTINKKGQDSDTFVVTFTNATSDYTLDTGNSEVDLAAAGVTSIDASATIGPVQLTVTNTTLTLASNSSANLTIKHETPTIVITAGSFTQGTAAAEDEAGTYVTDVHGSGGTPVVSFTSNPNTYYALVGGVVELTAAGATQINDNGTITAINLTVTDVDADPVSSTDSETPSVGGGTERNVTTIDPSSSQYFTIPAWTPSGNWTATFQAVAEVNPSTGRTIISGSSVSEDAIICEMSKGAGIRFFAYVGTTLQSILSVTNPKDGELHTINLSYTGTTASIDIDGGTPDTATWALNGAQDVANIATRGTDREFKGQLFGVALTDGVDDRDYAINESWSGPSTVLVDSISAENGTAVNITDSDAENYTLDDVSSPNTWTNDGATIVIDIAGT